MAKNKFYAVKKGKNVGIFNTWNECEENIKGFSGAIYKGFLTLEEAKEWLDEYNKEVTIVETDYDAIAYVDGSYNDKIKTFTYGLVFIYNNKVLNYKEKFNNSKWVGSRNIAGEIMGVVKAIQIANEGNINSLLIYHDLDGLGHWARGEWKTNTPETNAYKNFIEENKEELKLEFVSIKGHSGIKYNEMADKLANEAYSLKDFSPVLLDSNFIYIDKSLIDDYLRDLLSKKYGDKYNLAIEEDNEKIKKINISIDNKNVVINFNIKSTGAMTISFDGDKELGFEIKNEMEAKYSLTSAVPNNWFSLKMPNEILNKFKSSLLEQENIKLINRASKSTNILETFLIQNKNNKITCTVFKNGSMVVQGKSSLLMSQVVTLLSLNGNLNSGDIVEISNRIYEKNNSVIQIEEELEKLTPNSYNKLNPIIKNFLICSVANLHIEKQATDYSDVCFQSLKALEGQINIELNNFTNLPVYNNGNYKLGEIFNKNEKINEFKMLDKFKTIINNHKLINCLENMYDYYNRERHTSFHTDVILVQTRILSMEEAREVILTCISLIDAIFE